MDKQRSKTSLEITKPSNSNPQQKYSVVIEVHQKSSEKQPSKIKALNTTEAEIIKLETNDENLFQKENPELQTANNLIYQTPLKSDKSAILSPLHQQCEQKILQPSKQAIVNFEQFFSQKKKYSSLAKINSSFLSVIQSGKICISPQKLSVGSKQNKFKIQPNLENLLSQEEQKIKLITSRKELMLEELNKLYAEEREVRSKRKALILSRRIHHESTNLLRSHTEVDQSPIKKLKKIPKKVSQSSKKSPQILNPLKDEVPRKSIERDNFTHDQKKSIARILKAREIKQIEFERKIEQVVQKAEKQKMQNIQLEKQQKQIERQKRRSKVLQRLETSKFQRKSIFRQKSLSETPFKTEPSEGLKENQFFTEADLSQEKQRLSMPKSLPKRRYIYKQFQKQKAEKQIELKKYQEVVLQKRRQETKINFEEIKVHLQKYKQIKTKQIQLEREKIQTLRSQQKQRLKQIRQRYGFLTKIKQNMLDQEKKSIEILQSQLDTKVNYQKRMKEYFQSVKEKTQSGSRYVKVQNRVKTSMSSENEGANQEASLQASKNSTFNKISKLQNKLKNKTHFLTRKKDSFQSSNSRVQIFTQQKIHNKQKKLVSNLKKNLCEEFERKQTAMMNILKNEDASIQDIQKAFGIFKDLNKSFWQSQNNHKGKLIKSQGHLFPKEKATKLK